MENATNQANTKAKEHAIYLGARVRALRLMQKMTLTEVANVLGVTQQQLQKYETGKNRITVYRLEQLSQLYGVEVQTFFEQKAAISHEANKWHNVWAKLAEPAKQALALEMAEAIARSDLR